MMDDTEAPPYDPKSGAPHPALAQFVGQQTTQGGQDWAIDTAQALQQHITAQAIVGHAQDQGDALVNNLQTFKQGAAGYVRKDPTALDTVLNIVPKTIDAITGAHGVDGADLTKHIQGEAVKSAIQTYAEQHQDIATQALDRYKDYLAPGEADHLGQYIDNMAAMRQADYEGERRDQLRQIYNQSDTAAISHLGELSHPSTGDLNFPQAWGQRMMANPVILPATKATLLRAYAGLQVNGEPQQPNPGVVSGLIQRAADPAQPNPTVSEVISHVGQTLSAADGAWLASKVRPQTPAGRDEIASLSDVMGQARAQIGNARAYDRWMGWFLPAYQRATAQGLPPSEVLSPESKGYVLAPERMARFMPTGDDVAAAIPRSGPRRSLKEIFGG